MRRMLAGVALALVLVAPGAEAKVKPQPKMQPGTVATLSTQNAAGGQEWLPFAMMMIILIGIITNGSGSVR